MGQLVLQIFALTLTISGSVLAAVLPISRPSAPDGGPTEVRMQMVLVDVDEINSVAQSFVANCYIQAQWQDARLAHERSGIVMLPLDDVWHPRLQFVNQQKIWSTMPEVVAIAPDGTVTYRQRIWGPFSQPLLVYDFPFDRQTFEIRLVATDHAPQEVRFVPNPHRPSGLAPRFSQPDWEILQWRLDTGPYDPLGGDAVDASVVLRFDAKRHSGYYLLKIIMPLAIIVAMSWLVFWIDPLESGTQIAVATTAMLTLVTYRFVVGAIVPNVSYLTRLDKFLLGSTLLVFGALILTVGTSILAQAQRIATARRIDLCCRVAFPALLLLVAMYAFIL